MDVDDLIREADLMLSGEGFVGRSGGELIRALRDALRAEQKDGEIIADALDEERAYSAHLRDEVTRAKEWQGIGVAVRFAEFQEARRWAEWFAAERDLYREGIDWNSSCLGCARTLSACYEAERERDEANATIERISREVNMIAAHRTDWDDNGPDHDEWLASLGEKRLGGPDIAYRGIQYAVMRLRRAIKGEQ